MVFRRADRRTGSDSFLTRLSQLPRAALILAATALTLLGTAPAASAAAFTAGNVLIYRVGDGSAVLASSATAAFLDEYSPTGTLVQSIALPTTGSAPQLRCTAAGTATTEGFLSRSPDGAYVSFGCYDAALATATPNTSTTVARVLGRIDSTGTLDTTTSYVEASGPGNIRSVTTSDGNRFWVGGSTVGVRTTTLGSSSVTTVSTTNANLRQVHVYGGQLYASSGAGSAFRLGQVGTGLPTAGSTTTTNLPGLPVTNAYNSFFFADLDAGVAGVDTLYIADETANAIDKFSLVSGTWTANGTVALSTARGLIGTVSGSNVTLYAIGNTNNFAKVTDTAGYNATMNGTVSALATPGTNKAFRGITLVPQAAAAFPTVSSINRVSATPTNASSVDYTVTFSESVTGVDATDFTLTTSGVTGASVSNVTGSGTTYTVSVNTGSGDGTIRLDVTDDDTINGSSAPLGGAGTGNGNFTTGQSYTTDKTAPAVSSSNRASADPTGLSSVDFTVTFSESVTGVDTSDFSLTTTGVTGTSITGVTGSGTTWTVSVNTGSGSTGTIRLDVNNGASIADAAGNALAAGFTSGQTYTVDRNAPTVTSVVRASSNPTRFASVDYTVTFSAAVTGVDSSDFTLTTTGVTGTSVSNVTGSGTTYTVTVATGSGDGTIRLDVVSNGSILGPTSVPMSSGFTSGEVYTVDKTAPTVSSIVRANASPTSATSVNFTVTYSEPVSGVSAQDWSLNTTGVTGATVTATNGSGTTYTVTVDTGSGDGTIRLDVITGGTVIDMAGNLLATGFTGGETYTVNKSPVAQGLVISQLYGGNGNAYANDYVELFNSTANAIDISGYSIQYGSATGQFGSFAGNVYVFPASTSIAANHYLTVRFGTAGSGLPVAFDLDAPGGPNMSGTSGKVALVTNGTALGCGATATPCALPDLRIVDLVAYGTSNNAEGGSSVNDGTAISASAGPLRKGEGCTDTDNNLNDFTVATTAAGLAPRTAATPPHTCPPPNHAPTITAPSNPIATVAENAAPFTVNLTGSDDNSIYNWSATPGTGVTSVTVSGGQGTNNITYNVTLQTNFYGTATFTASLSDGVNTAATRLVNITVTRDTNINHPPTITAPANPAAFAAQNAAPFTINLTGSDDNGLYAWAATPVTGISSVNVTSGQGTPTVTYTVTLANGFIGTASFTASLSDGVNPATTQTVNIGVSPSGSSVSHVVISQVYGGGGNAGATWSNDYVELYNPTGSPVNMAGWTIQYASATNTADWGSIAPIGGTIGPGEYFLVGLASGGAVGSALPATNVNGDINLSASAGKVALVSNGDPLTGSCGTLITDTDIVDFIGYGTANCSEGNSPAAAPANTTLAMYRASGGNVDTNVNGSDFSTAAANPRRTSPIQEIGPSVVNVDPRNGNAIAPRDANLVITFSEPVNVTGTWYDINCNTTGNHSSATFAGDGTRTLTIIPNVNFLAGEQCTAQLFKDFIHDVDTDDSGPGSDILPADYSWTFTIASGTAPPYPSSVHLTMGNPSGAVADTNVPNNYLMEKPEMALSYNRDKGTPNWVSWHLSDEWVGSLTRIDTFRADPAVPSDWYRVLGSDFQSSGFDRGHMMPNADRDKETSVPINQATFLMSNMVPQSPDNNQGPWAALENDLRALLPANELYIVSGPNGQGGSGSAGGTTMTIANGHVVVPASTWKVVLVLPKASGDDVSHVTAASRTIAVIMPNVQGIRSDDWHNYLTTVDAVEALTGYNFFSNVPNAIQNAIEGGTNGVNPPGAANESVSTNEDVAKSITLDGVSPTNGTLTYTIVTPPSHGGLTGSGAARTYTPTTDYNGSDSFTYKVNDGSGDSNTATVSITVLEVNDTPSATDDNQSTNQNTPVTFSASTLTTNDSAGPANESTQTLTVTAVTGTVNTHGTVSLNTGMITYTPAAGYNGAASFTYTVCDNGTTAGSSDPLCATGNVLVTVNPSAVVTKSDFNADSRSDILLQNTGNASVAAWLMNDTQIIEGKVVATPSADQQIVATGDLNGDGKADIILKNNTSGAISVWFMNGTTLVSGAVISTPATSWRVVGARDFNGDGKADIVLQNSSTGAVALWRMNGATLVTGYALGTPGAGAASRAIAVGSLGGNAIVFQNTTTNAISRWVVDSNSVVTSQIAITTPVAGWNVVTTADFNHDGYGDLALQNSSSRAVAVWLLDANGTAITQAAVVATPAAGWQLVGAGDYNGNGDSDLLLYNSSSNGIAQWQMSGTTIAAGWNIGTAPGWKPLGN